MEHLMNTAKLIIHICVIVHACVNTCNIHVCLTWEFENSSITFKCKVNYLVFNVEFYNPANQNQGRCLIPIPNTECYPLHNNSLTQDVLTNTTTLTVKSVIEKNNGTWKCTHGTNTDVAIVKVPVLRRDAEKLVEMPGLASSCWQYPIAWTAMGFFLVVLIFTVLHGFVYMCCEDKAKKKCSVNKKIYAIFHRIMLLCRIIAGLAVFIIPLMVGLHDTKCTNSAEYTAFAIFGLCCAFVLMIRILAKKKDISTSSPQTFRERNAARNKNSTHELEAEETSFLQDARNLPNVNILEQFD